MSCRTSPVGATSRSSSTPGTLSSEFEGPLPGGTRGHGFYNLKGGGGLSGHLRATNCRAIVFLRRPFMGMDTLSVQFFNANGEAMFKIFVGRDENRRLKADQVERFARLKVRFAAAGQET